MQRTVNDMNYVEYIRQYVGHKPVILVGAVVIIVNEEEEVLLQQRKSTSYGSWGLPGGLMELKESTEETARREVMEETGLKVSALKLEEVMSGEDCHLKVSNGDEFYSVTIVYSTNDYEGEINVDEDESLDIRFHKLSDLPEEMVGSHRRMIVNYIDRKSIHWCD